MLFIILILIAWIIIFTFNFFFNISISILNNIVCVVLSTIAVVLIDAILAIVTHRVPESKIDVLNKKYQVANSEKRFYEKLGIKKWKDHVPELGRLANFSKAKVEEPKNPSYTEKFLKEIIYGRWDHFLSGILGFLIIPIFLPFSNSVWITLPVSIVNLILNFMCLAVLRYNFVKILVLHKYNLKNVQKGE